MADAAPSAPATAGAGYRPWGETLSRRRIAAVIVSVMLGMLLSAVDQTVVGTAMPRIVADLNGLQHYAWVATAYLLASTASMPIWGKLSDAFGRRRYFILGMLVFVGGSALCGQSNGMTELIAFRALQGLGAGAMMPISQAIIGDIFPPAERARWTGILMSVFAVATIVGPLLGGWITDNIGWRWAFYVNLPLGAVAVTTAAVALPGHVALHRHRIDYAGAALLVAAAVPLLLGFSWAGSEYPWASIQIFGLFVFSGVAWLLFLARELRAAEPIINPRLFQNRIFSVSALASTLQSAAMFGAIMFLPLFVQGVLGKSATNSGIILMPMMLAAMATSIGAGQLLARTGRYKALVIAGFSAVTAGAYLLARMDAATSSTVLALNMVVMGLGLGVAMSTFTAIVQNQYPSRRLGEVTAGLQFFRSIGATVGLAIFGTILTNRFAAAMADNVPAPLRDVKGLELHDPQVLLSDSASAKLQEVLSSFGGQGRQLFDAFMSAVRDSLAGAIGDVFTLAAIVGAAGLVVVLFLREVPLRKTHDIEAAHEEISADTATAAGAALRSASAQADESGVAG